MSEIMRPLPFARLIEWALQEYRQEGRVFGLAKEKFYEPPPDAGITLWGRDIATPIGPAAGPHTQLAQNLITAYLAGSRFLELKTVQQLDGAALRAAVPRPCIQAEDEGYNVEWSTELTVEQALAEYVKAYLAIQVLAKEFGLAEQADFIFNMSVGYDLAGIQSAKIDTFINRLKSALEAEIFWECMVWLEKNLGQFERVTGADLERISPQVSNSVTLSTLHGCPLAEIERIASYLLTEKRLHTYVKCNPTLLGYDFTRQLLDELGYGYLSFDAHHFENDLQYGDAVPMLERLLDLAETQGLAFGVKLTNTFPVKIARGELPGEEMYLSGRALFPLSINVAAKLAEDFQGRLPISYCGGADLFNIKEIFETGIRPVTVATTILKPGGYARLQQLAGALAPFSAAAPAAPDASALRILTARLADWRPYRKEARPVGSRKTAAPLAPTDCFLAPCRDGGCPIAQRIPAYLALVAAERYAEAFALIALDNAAPGVTGEICNHNCQNKCTRLDYEQPLQIRQAKRLAVEAAQQAYLDELQPAPLKSAARVCVVGAGPAGLAAALYLRRNGVAVTVIEQREKPFGLVQYVIPAFRIAPQTIARDYQLALKVGVEFRFGVRIDPAELTRLRAEYAYVVLALGAWGAARPALREGAALCLDALAFLEESKAHDCGVTLGQRVAVIGGGDVAMDCARAAQRAPGVAQVTVVYRRTRAFMPAQPEEIALALADGVALVELHAPLRFDGKELTCEVMRLGDWDASGRRGIVGTGEERTLAFDCVINATGARVESDFFAAAGLALDERGDVVVDEANQSAQAGVYLAGDCKSGPATVVAALGDAKRIARDILGKLELSCDFEQESNICVEDVDLLAAKKGLLQPATADHTDAARCLGCAALCEVCCDVCPNRANLSIALPGCDDVRQILHLDGFCNECGNCGVFCPHADAPYTHKWTLYWREEDFHDSINAGFCRLDDDRYLLRSERGGVALIWDAARERLQRADGQDTVAQVPAALRQLIAAVAERHAYLHA